MARKKGATKTKSSGGGGGRKAASEAKQTDKRDAKVKDDPGGALPPAMEISNSCSESKITSVSQQQQQNHTKPSTNSAAAAAAAAESKQQVSAENSSLQQQQQQPPPSSSSSSNSSDLKYLHKKFKRIASATLASEVTSAEVAPPQPPSAFEPVQPQSTTTTCAKGVSSNLVVRSSSSEVERVPSVQPIGEEEAYSRLQLTPSLNSRSGGDQQQQQQHSNGASLNCANHISDSNSFISNNHIPRGESEDLKSYQHPSVNNNSASCDPSEEKNQCNSVLSTVVVVPPVLPVVAISYEQQQQHHNNSASLSPFSNNHHHLAAVVDGTAAAAAVATTTTPGRYVCPYCSMNCSKPSVLQKHIRRHTNERPFRCDPCGIAFKTKSNLYKHCRSRAHASKSQGDDIGANLLDEDGGSLGGSDIDDKELSNSGSEIINRGSPMDDRVHSPQLLVEKPYKPKFHNAALYTKFDAKLASKFQVAASNVVVAANIQNNSSNMGGHSLGHTGVNSVISNSTTNLSASHSAPSTPHYLNGQTSLEQHISKLISDNEAIVDVVEPPLQKKYHKITGITRGISVSSSSNSSGHDAGSSSRLATALLHKRNSEEEQMPPQQPVLIPQPQYVTVATVVPNEQQIVISGPSKVKPNPPRVINLATHGHPVQNHHQQPVPVPLMVRPTALAAGGSNEVQYQQPLNLTKPVPSEPQQTQMEYEHSRKRSAEVLHYSREQSPSYSGAQQQQQQYQPQPATIAVQQSPAPQSAPPPPPQQTQPPVTVTDHPQNPERSIIKDLLLNSRGFGVVQNPENENAENLFTCKSCNISFRDAEILKYHTICYCQGNSSNLNSPSSSAPISPVGSPSSSHFMRSKSAASDRFNPTSLKTLARVSLNPPSRNPSTLSKLAKSQLKLPRGRPENISLPPKESSSSSSTASCPVPEHSSNSSSGSSIPMVAKIVDVVQNPLPSPGPLLGNTRLVDFQTHDGGRSLPESNVIVSHVAPSDMPQRKHHPSSNEQQHLLRRVQHPSLQLFGGDVEVVSRNEELRRPHRYTSGGTITYSPEVEPETTHDGSAGRTSMHSGGSFMQVAGANRSTSPVPVVNHATPKLIVTITPTLTPSLTTPNFFHNQQQAPADSAGAPQQPITHFHFPPINSITAYNPLTLPQVSPGQASQIMHAGKLIPFVQGIPGPNSMMANHDHPKISPRIAASPSPSVLQSISINTGNYHMSSAKMQSPSLLTTVSSRQALVDPDAKKAFLIVPPMKNGLAKEIWSPAKQEQHNLAPKKSFNFTRIADNISPRKKETHELAPVPPKKEEIRYFNFENLISKSEILIKTPTTPAMPADNKPEPMVVEPLPPPPTVVTKPKFLRPNSLPLKPGTFTPKRHHGITPTHNTMPLISPETPRQSKSCRELYFNGHAYTNIGLKSSTKPFYCTVNKTQPFYVQTQKQLSMYSNWQVHPENDPHPLGLKAVVVMSLYDSSQQRDHRYSIATKQLSLAVVNSSSSTSLIMSTVEAKTNYPTFSKQVLPPVSSQNYVPYGGSGSYQPAIGNNDDSMPPRSESSERTLSGGFESTEEYTYVRGRGRGKYVCKECGIRCKKPSMLKKHIRTHTDVRPYSCQYCSFHFKTKGNLTKHMKSKSHFKKCTELGLNPIPTSVDDDGGDIDIEGDQQSISSERTSTIPGDSDTGSDTDGDDSDDSDESKSRLPEHEAAHCLLSLSMTPPTQQPAGTLKPTGYGPTISPGLPQQPQMLMHAATEPSQPSPRRVITFGNTPKVEFNLLKHEQYYSDPNLSKKKREFSDDDGAMPMDLTKKSREPAPEVMIYQQRLPVAVAPRSQVIVRVSDVVTPITGAANLLTSLVSNTDKIPVTSHMVPGGKELVDDNVYFQEYIKQRALQDSRMKQSQMKGLNNNQYEVEVANANAKPTPEMLPTVIPAAKQVVNEKPYRIFNGKNEIPPKQIVEPIHRVEVVEVGPPVKPVSYPSQEPKEALVADPAEPSVSRMDTLAEVAAGSVKLDSEPVARPRSDSMKANNEASKESAKSVASEYLKLTKSVTLRKREDSESGTASDQDETKVIAAATPIVAPIVAPVVVVPPTTALPATAAEIGGIVARTVVVGEDGFKTTTPANEFSSLTHFQEDGGRPVCEVCNKKFQKISQLKIHMNIHYMERKFRCEPCGTSFRSQGLFLKHERSATHRNKVSMTTTFGIATDSNPRPFYCKDCDVGFRIHGHLAKHLRSKMHVLKLECLGKLPFGTYTEIERSGTNLTEIDTTDCENSLSSLKRLAVRLNVKDPANVLPGDGAIPSGSGNETDSCDDAQYENDNESAGDEDMDDEEPVPQSQQAPQVNNNHLSMKRKPDDSSTSNDSSSEETKRARFHPAAAASDFAGVTNAGES